MLGELRDQLGRCRGKGAPRVVLEMPVGGEHVAQKAIERPIVVDRTLCKNLCVQVARVPVVQHHSDIEDDGSWLAHSGS